MQRDDEDDVWRSIVENYGDRPDLEPDPDPEAPPTEPGPAFGDVVDPHPHRPLEEPPDERSPEPPPEAESDLARADEERFVPPPPPPLPRPARDRLIAWVGVFGAPALLLLSLVLSLDLPQVVALGLVVWFVAGFLYLVWRMPRGPRDPWDDGATL